MTNLSLNLLILAARENVPIDIDEYKRQFWSWDLFWR